jgi:hypothetical protein
MCRALVASTEATTIITEILSRILCRIDYYFPRDGTPGVILFLRLKHSASETFDRRARPLERLLPCIERTLQAVEVLSFELHPAERVPGVGIVGSDGDNAPA